MLAQFLGVHQTQQVRRTHEVRDLGAMNASAGVGGCNGVGKMLTVKILPSADLTKKMKPCSRSSTSANLPEKNTALKSPMQFPEHQFCRRSQLAYSNRPGGTDRRLVGQKIIDIPKHSS